MALADLPLTQNKINSLMHTYTHNQRQNISFREREVVSVYERRTRGNVFIRSSGTKSEKRTDSGRRKKRGQAERADYKLS